MIMDLRGQTDSCTSDIICVRVTCTSDILCVRVTCTSDSLCVRVS